MTVRCPKVTNGYTVGKKPGKFASTQGVGFASPAAVKVSDKEASTMESTHRKHGWEPGWRLRRTIALIGAAALALLAAGTCWMWDGTHSRLIRAEDALRMMSGAHSEAECDLAIIRFVDTVERHAPQLHELAARHDALGERARLALVEIRRMIR